jgi:nucleotide-binding universal stress UspA family protein
MLLCYDGSDDARHAIAEAAACWPGRPASVLHVAHSFIDWGMGPSMGPLLDIPGVDEALREEAQTILDEGVRVAREAGLPAEPMLRMTPRAVWRTINDVAEELDAGVIVAGSHGERLRDLLPLGSVARSLMSHARRPVLVTHEGDRVLPRTEELRVLVGYDGSPTAEHALDAAVEQFTEADLHVATVWERVHLLDGSSSTSAGLLGAIGEYDARLRTAAREIAERGAARARAAGAQAIAFDAPAATGVGSALLELARDIQSDVIVVGSHGHSAVVRAVLGSAATFLVQRADRPVLMVPPATPTSGDEVARRSEDAARTH